MELTRFIKERRKQSKLSQPELAEKAGVGLRFIRELEQGKESLKLDKINQVLKLFGHKMGPVPIDRNKIDE
jgi:y4mF family transcriptional regulator